MKITLMLQKPNLTILLFESENKLVLTTSIQKESGATDWKTSLFEIENTKVQLIIIKGNSKQELFEIFATYEDSQVLIFDLKNNTRLYVDMLSSTFIELSTQKERVINPDYENENLQIFIETN